MATARSRRRCAAVAGRGFAGDVLSGSPCGLARAAAERARQQAEQERILADRQRQIAEQAQRIAVEQRGVAEVRTKEAEIEKNKEQKRYREVRSLASSCCSISTMECATWRVRPRRND